MKTDINIELGDLADSVVSRLMSTSSFKIIPYSGTASGVDVEKWLQDFERIATAMKWTDENKFEKFPAYMSGAADDWYTSYIYESTSVTTWPKLTEAFIEYFTPSGKKANAREQLRKRKQRSNEPVGDFIACMHSLC